MARVDIVFEPGQNAPAVNIMEIDIEGNGVDFSFSGDA